jgi:hypothetical protein
MRQKDAYTLLGGVLSILGMGLLLVSYFILHSIPLTALGISSAILAMVCLMLSRTRMAIPPEVSSLLLETALENVATVVEEMGVRSKAIYLPSRISGGEPRALIPLHSKLPPNPVSPLPKRFIVKYGPQAEQAGLLISTAGSKVMRLAQATPGPTSEEIESALNSIIVGCLDLAASVRIRQEGKRVTVELVQPSITWGRTMATDILGSPVASIVASVVAEAMDKPVIVEREEGAFVHLEVLG